MLSCYVDPPLNEQAVAVGAAVQGHILAMGDARTGGADLAGTTDLLLLDVTPLSLGIELEGREMSVLIKRNTTIPCRKSRSYTTVEDWQTSIDVVVYEVGELNESVYGAQSSDERSVLSYTWVHRFLRRLKPCKGAAAVVVRF